MNQKKYRYFSGVGKIKNTEMQVCRYQAGMKQEALAFHETFHNGDTHSRFFL